MVKLPLRQPYSLINSEFNDFLFAPIGDEANGMTLSVISAFARLDIDPWGEAARLSDLSKEKAAQALAPIIARLPGGRWAPADIRDIATRLVAFLPRRDRIAPSTASAPGAGAKPRARDILLVVALVFSAVFWFAMAMHHQSPSSRDNAPTENSETDLQH
jgi:hypothetical protein